MVGSFHSEHQAEAYALKLIVEPGHMCFGNAWWSYRLKAITCISDTQESGGRGFQTLGKQRPPGQSINF